MRSLITLLFVVGSLFAGSASAAPDARQVLTASPVDDIVAQYPAMLSEGLRDGLAASGGVPPMVIETVGFIVRNSVTAEAIEREIVDGLARGLSDQQLQAVHDWYQTPVAKKIAQAEIAASAPSAWRELQAQAPALNQKYRGTDRARQFTRFDRASRATESSVDLAIAVQLGLVSAVSAISSDSVHYDALRQDIEGQRSMIEGVVGQQVYDSYLYTYRDIGQAEFEQYLAFLESDAGRAFSRVVIDSIETAITGPIEQVGSQLARFLGPGNSAAQ